MRHTDARCRPTGRLRVELIVTAYEQVWMEQSALQSIHWAHVVVDEAHRLKNNESRLFKSLSALRRAGCTLLTGTPVQNNVAELLALIRFVDPHKFDHSEVGRLLELYGTVTTPEHVMGIQSLIAPYLLRRTKADLVERLPPKTETLLKVELTVSQKRVYRAIIDRSLAHIVNPRSSLSNVFMQLRKVCNHPMLLEDGPSESQRKIDVAFGVLGGGTEAGACRLDTERRRSAVQHGVDELVQGSGKMVLLDKLLPKLRSQQRKVLIFSQFASMLDLLSDYLLLRAADLGGHERIDGRTRHDERQAAIDRFQADPAIFAFLLSTRAGGQGINLTAADTVIMFDSDWNPQGDLQGQARAHRIGQCNAVEVYRLVTAATYEERMLQRAWSKLSLEHAILHGGFGRAPGIASSGSGPRSRMSRDEIEEILRFGAYGVLRDGSDVEARRFCDADIDDLLKRGVRVEYSGSGVLHLDGGDARQAGGVDESGDDEPEPENTSSRSSLKSGIFSRAIFRPVGGEEAEDLSLDDPNFWSKLQKLQKMAPPSEPTPLPPRRREAAAEQAARLRHLSTAKHPAEHAADEDDEDAVCMVCAEADSHPGNEMLLCDGDGCERGCHLACLVPALVEVPSGEWLCPVCILGEAAGPSGGADGGTTRNARADAKRRRRAPGDSQMLLDPKQAAAAGGVGATDVFALERHVEKRRRSSIAPRRIHAKDDASTTGALEAAEGVLTRSEDATDPSDAPLLEDWILLEDGRVIGACVGKPGLKHRTKIKTSRIDLSAGRPVAGCRVRTIKGTIYSLGCEGKLSE